MLRAARVSRVVPVGTRGICLHSVSAPVLAHNAKHRGFKSTIWVEDTDEYWFSKLNATVRQGEAPTECPAPSRIELYNFDQLLKAPEVPTTDRFGNYSFKTKKRYSGKFDETLTQFAQQNKYDSKWWLSAAEVRKQNLRVKGYEQPCVQILNRTGKFYNADQFAKPDLIQLQPFSGATGRAYDTSVSSRLRQHAESIGASSCVYFTTNQLEKMQLHPVSGASPAEVESSSNIDLTLFALEDLEHPEQFMQILQRYPVTEPTNIITGQPLGESYKAEAAKAVNKYNYWVSKHDATARGFNLKANAKGIAPPSEGRSWETFNAEQLMDPVAAYQKIGRYIPANNSNN
jgi:hypothetical protein